MKKLVSIVSVFVALVLAPLASAHVVVNPSETTTATFEKFSVGVPNEREVPTTSLRLVVPDGLKFVSVNVAPGWQVNTKKSGTGEDAVVKEITWSAGAIPAGFREDFAFSAKTPDSAGELKWKAYQTYGDGQVVAWDMDEPKDGGHSDSEVKPASITKVTADATDAHGESDGTSGNISSLALILSIAAVALGGYAVVKKK